MLERSNITENLDLGVFLFRRSLGKGDADRKRATNLGWCWPLRQSKRKTKNNNGLGRGDRVSNFKNSSASLRKENAGKDNGLNKTLTPFVKISESGNSKRGRGLFPIFNTTLDRNRAFEQVLTLAYLWGRKKGAPTQDT